MNQPMVSVIVPVLNDAAQLRGLLSSLHINPDTEIIVVNGTVADPSMQAVRSRFARVQWTDSPPGRAHQMNCGGSRARGRWLLFLHADARLSPGWVDEIRRADRDMRTIGGSFRFVLDSVAVPARLIEWGVAQRVRWFSLPYGDQALFVRRDVFDALGGYRPLPLMEDVDLVRRSIQNLILVLLFLVGVGPERLAHVYYRGTPPSLSLVGARRVHRTGRRRR